MRPEPTPDSLTLAAGEAETKRRLPAARYPLRVWLSAWSSPAVLAADQPPAAGGWERTMAFDESLAARIRDALARTTGVGERKLFGCHCFFLAGNVLAGVWEDRLVVRLGPDQGEAALREPHVRAFDITGRPMRNWVAVEPEGVEDDDQLTEWIERAVKFVRTLPRK
jgi:hypothetical protein